MKKIALIVIALLVMANTALATSDDDKINIPKDWHGKKKIEIPRGELTQVVIIKYATPLDQSNEQKSTIIDIGDNDGAQDGYELSGLWWNLAKYTAGVPYTINPNAAVANYGLTQSAVVGAVKDSLEAWDSTTTKELYSNTPTVNNRARASIVRPDYKNVITWAKISDPSIIAIASMWYYTSTKELVDTDIIFNTYFKWGIDPDGEETTYSLSNAMDIQNICTHEAGHWTGLNDLYNNTYWAMTMYGYAAYGEVIKRSLEPGDIAGAKAVYGE